MSQPDRCPDCGAERPPNAPEGVCPRCSMRLGLGGPALSLSHPVGPDSTVALPPGPGVLDSLAFAVGPVPRVLLRDTDPAEHPATLILPASPGMPGPAERLGRLQLFGEIARGGMGVVHKGRDPDLGRDLAVKVLLEEHREDPGLVRRFIEEAQIAGQLQHPGIVPVYELGTFTDRRPYFSMKLIKGRTLAGLLSDRGSPADELPRFLGVFESVCQTVAYAHARGVIHRDLKPSNVMIGSFGEVQVMDWGLAKVLPRGGAVDDALEAQPDVKATVIATARSAAGSDLTQDGSALGTPSYMAPEQARGEVERLDERCDVFALGSILCEVLTGHPAFLGRSSGEVRRKAERGDLTDAFARLDASGADAELIALARDCLAPEHDDRPRDAAAVAGRVSAYLAGVQEKLRRSEIGRVEERARRRLTTVAAAAVILLGLAGGGGYAWNQRQKAERLAKTARAVEDALVDAARLRGEAQAAPPGETAKWGEALSAAKRAEGLLAQGEAGAPLRGRVAALLAQLDRERAAAVERANRLEVDRVLLAGLESIRGNRAEHWDPKRTDAEYAAAFRKAGLDLDKAGEGEAGKWVAARSEPAELAGYLDDWINARVFAKRPDPDRRRLVAVARAADPDPWRDALRAQLLAKGDTAPATLRRMADDGKALDAQPAASLLLLARQLRYRVDDRERAARVLRRAASRHPGDFWAHFELAAVNGGSYGEVSDVVPRPEEGVRHLTAAAAIRPGSAIAHSNLGVALLAQGKSDEAAAELREAIRLNPDHAGTHVNLGAILCDVVRDYPAAEAEFREAIRLQPDDATAHINLGIALEARGKAAEAAAAFREAIRLKPGYAKAHYRLGNSLRIQGKAAEAAVAFREADRLEPGRAEVRVVLGNALLDQGNPGGAVAEYREAVRREPGSSEAHLRLGYALQAQGKSDEAAAELREAVRLQPDRAETHYNLGLVLQPRGNPGEVAAEYREAIRLKPDLAEAHCNLGLILKAKGDFAEALAELRRGHELGSKRPGWRYPSSEWVRQAERAVALASRLPAVLKGEEKPRDAPEGAAFALLTHETGRHAAAARLWADAFAADPKLAADLRAQHRYNAACAAALAGCGKGKDDPAPDEPARARLRQQALEWLRAEHAAWAKLLESGPPQARPGTIKVIQNCREGNDFAGVRDPEALARLPDDERTAWRVFWDDVDSLRKKPGGGPP